MKKYLLLLFIVILLPKLAFAQVAANTAIKDLDADVTGASDDLIITSDTSDSDYTKKMTTSDLFGIATDLDDGGIITAVNSAEWITRVTDETGTGLWVFATSPTFVTPTLGVADATTLNTGQGDNELYDMDQNVLTTSTVTFDALTLTTTDLTVPNGGTGASTFTDGGILLGSGAGAITALGVATNGQIPIGDGATDPVLATITGTANEVTVTNGAGSITLSLPDPIVVDVTGAVSGNAGTATALETARTIAGVSFDGTANIDIPLDGLSDIGTSTATAGNILIGDGGDWESETMSGDATIATGGALTIADSVTVTGWVMGASTATTPAADDDDTSLATTAYVQGELITSLSGLSDVGNSTATSGNILIGDGVNFDTQPMSGDCTITSAGVMSCTGGSGATELSGLSDVGTSTATAGWILQSDGVDFDSTGTIDFGSVTLEIPNGIGDFTLTTSGQVAFNSSEEQIVVYSAANGIISGEAAISVIRHLTAGFDPAGWYDQESTYRVVPLMTVERDAPEGIQIVGWRVNYVGGDPTTELDADLMCDTTPDYNPAAGATVMDVLDTTAGASNATSGFDSATCATASKMYIRFGADPTDANVIVQFDLEFYNEED